MTNFVLSIDPGLSTGIALLSYDAETPAQLVRAWQFSGGIDGLIEWVAQNISWHVDLGTPPHHVNPEPVSWSLSGEGRTTVIAEKFNARPTKGFGYTTASLEPLPAEGVLRAYGLMPRYTPQEKRWRDPGQQYIFGGKDLADKKKRQHAWLKENGFYRTNKHFPDSPSKDDADDFRSAAAHGICYVVKEVNHKPTWDLVRGYSDE